MLGNWWILPSCSLCLLTVEHSLLKEKECSILLCYDRCVASLLLQKRTIFQKANGPATFSLVEMTRKPILSY